MVYHVYLKIVSAFDDYKDIWIATLFQNYWNLSLAKNHNFECEYFFNVSHTFEYFKIITYKVLTFNYINMCNKYFRYLLYFAADENSIDSR